MGTMTEAELRELIAQAKDEQWEELDLAGMELEVLPPEIGELTQLKRLWLGKWDEEKREWVGNRLTRLPDELWELRNLEELWIPANQLTEIPDAIAQLSNLTLLGLHNNQIAVIPDAIAQLSNLTGLYLHNNQIAVIPDAIAQLSNLTGLYLSNNQIAVIPDAIAQLSNLTRLWLSNNQIAVIPDALAQLSNLTRLDLDNNQIAVIPDAIAQLSNLTELWLSDNQIAVIPDAIAQLSNLTELYLSDNQIAVIPDAIGQLEQLETLDLKNNQIIEIPQRIRELKALKNLGLQGNPIAIPPEILAYKSPEKKDWESPDAKPILDYYFAQRDPDETHILYEAKLLLVGEGGSGKTSLANKLLNPDYALKPETEDTSTEGIDILKWEFTGRDGNDYRIHIWDFGGQEIYHQTHQFFLTERSFYLLVADSRKEDTDHYFWLQIVQLLSNDSPVLLIQNEKHDRDCTLNYNQLRGEFANLRDTYRINLADNRGLTELQSAIQHELEKLIPNGIPFPNKWLAVRHSLQNNGRNYIDCTEYEATCRRHGITQRQEMCQLSHFLHDLGICLHFQTDPILCNRLILKPNWGTTAVYKILDNERVKQNLGQFNDADLADIWQAEEYDSMRHQLLQLMKEFKVCYEIPRRKGEYIAPHLLSPESPDYLQTWNGENNLILRYKYKGFMPKGILTRFIVEMHKDIENVSEPDNALVWKSGVVLQKNGARAEVIEYYHKWEIVIRVSGNRPRDLMTVINRKFEEIHDVFNLKSGDYDTLIPCNCSVCKPTPPQPLPEAERGFPAPPAHPFGEASYVGQGAGGLGLPFMFPLDRLYSCLDKGRYTIECHESGEDVNVRGLIDGVIIDAFDDPEFWDGDDRLGFPGGFSGKFDRDRVVKSRRDRSRYRREPPTPKVNFSLTLNNNNQQEQEMSQDKQQHLHGDYVRGDKFAGDKVAGNKMQTGNVAGDAIAGNKIVTTQNLADAAKEIQAIIEQLSTTHSTNSMMEKVAFAEEVKNQIAGNPSLGGRILSASKAGGIAAIEQFLNHPLASFVMAALEDWQKNQVV